MTDFDFSALKNLKGIDLASLEKLAKPLMQNPLLKKAFEEQVKDEKFHKTVDELYNEIKDIFDHVNSPKK